MFKVKGYDVTVVMLFTASILVGLVAYKYNTASAQDGVKLAAAKKIEEHLPDLGIDLERYIGDGKTSLAYDLSLGLGLETMPSNPLNYYLPANPNPYGRTRGTYGGKTMKGHFYIGRSRTPSYVVVHTAEGGGPTRYSISNDKGADNVANYFSTSSRAASYNALVDSNSVVWTVPLNWTAFQASCCNRSSVGVSVATRAADWQKNNQWDDRSLLNLAITTAQINENLKMPYRHVSGSEAINGRAGFTGHGEVQPKNRTDPGSKFDWYNFLSVAKIVDDHSDGAAPPTRPNQNSSSNLSSGSRGDEVRLAQSRLAELGYSPGAADGIFGTMTETAVLAFQAQNELDVDGVIGPKTKTVLFSKEAKGPARITKEDPHLDEPEKPTDQLKPTQAFFDDSSLKKWSAARDWINALRDNIDRPGQLLSVGDSGNHPDAVRVVKRRLSELGYNPGSDTGPTANSFTAATDAAVRNFQARSRLDVDGLVGASTWDRLFPVAVLYPERIPDTAWPDKAERLDLLRTKLGVLKKFARNNGAAVRLSELRLRQLGFDPGPIDTIFDAQTERALKSFQKASSLAQDGIIGVLTWDVLFPERLIYPNGRPAVKPVDTSNSNATYTPAPVPTDKFVTEFWNVQGVREAIPTWKPDVQSQQLRISSGWGQRSPHEKIDPDMWIGRWRSKVSRGGTYKLTVKADDGTRLFVNDKLVINNWIKSGQIKEVSTTVDVEDNWLLRLEHIEVDGLAYLELFVEPVEQASVTPVGAGTTLPPNTWSKSRDWINSLRAKTVAAGGRLRVGVDNDKAAVRVVQRRLNALEYNSGAEDGIFGDRTARAVKAFQTDSAVSSNGVVNSKTWDKLFPRDLLYPEEATSNPKNTTEYPGVLMADRAPSPSSKFDIADLNRDGKIDVTDVSIFVANWRAGTNAEKIDLNRDGKVTKADLSLLIDKMENK